MLPFWHHLELSVSTTTNGQSSSPCFLPPQEQAWPLFRESLGCLREDFSLNNTDTRFRFRSCYCMSTRTALLPLWYGDSTTRGDAQSPFRSQIQKFLMAMLLSIVSSWILDNTLYNQLFAVWKGSQVSRWSTHNQKPRPCSWCFLLKIDQNMKLEKYEMRVFPRVTEDREHKRNR